MKKAALVGILILPFAYTSYASEVLPNGLHRSMCKAGTIVKTFSVEELNSQDQFIGDKNVCTDEVIEFDTADDKIVDHITCLCTTEEESAAVGCAEGNRMPTVTYTIDRSQSRCVKDSIKISKCAVPAKKAYEAICQRTGAAAINIYGTSDPITISADPALRPALLAAQLEAVGVPPAEAQTLSTERPQAAADYIKAIANSTVDEPNIDARKVSAAALGINPNLTANAEMLSAIGNPEDAQNATDGRAATPRRYSASGNFFDSGDGDTNSSGQIRCGVTGIAGPIMHVESSCGRVTYNPAAPVQGPYQFMCGTWSSYTQTTGNGAHSCPCTSDGYYAGRCDAVNDPQIGAKVVNARYDLYQQQYGSQCSSIGAKWLTCAYGIHFLGEYGFQKLVVAQQADPNAPLDRSTVSRLFGPAAYSANQSVFNQAGTVGGLIAHLDGKISGASTGNSIPTGYSVPTGYSIPTGYSVPAGSPFAIAGGAEYVQPAFTGSPFGNVNPLSSAFGQNGQMANMFGGFGGGQAQPAGSPQAQQQHPIVAQQPQPAPLLTPVIPVAPATSTRALVAIALDVQPHSVARGSAVHISWSSVGTMAASPCSLKQDARVIATSNSGSKYITLSEGASETFTVLCTGASGDLISKSETVNIR